MSMLRFEGIRRRGLVAAAALGLLAAACGGDSEGNIVLDTSTSISPDDAASPSTTIAGDDSGSDAGDAGGGDDEVTAETSEVPADTAPTTTAPQAGQGTTLTDQARVSTLGLGPVYMGDTLAEVAEKIGVELVPDELGDETCRYYAAPGGPPGVLFLVAFDRIARVDIDDPSTITTRSGAGIGSTKEEIVGLFGDKIVVSEHPSGTGEYLTFVPVDDKDSNLRIVFETNGQGVVVNFRTGQLPEVDYINCN